MLGVAFSHFLLHPHPRQWVCPHARRPQAETASNFLNNTRLTQAVRRNLTLSKKQRVLAPDTDCSVCSALDSDVAFDPGMYDTVALLRKCGESVGGDVVRRVLLTHVSFHPCVRVHIVHSLVSESPR